MLTRWCCFVSDNGIHQKVLDFKCNPMGGCCNADSPGCSDDRILQCLQPGLLNSEVS